MEDDFDVSAAVDDIGAGLGFGDDPGSDDLVLDVGAKEVKEPAAEGDAPAPPAGGTEAPKPAEGTPAPPAEGTAPEDKPPLTWRKEASATWAQLPSEAKAEILKREADIFKGIESYKVDATFGKSVKQVVAPYEGYMRTAGIAPEAALHGLLQTHHTLGTGTPEQRLNLIREMAKSYNIDLAQAAQGIPEAPYVDPQVAALQKELQRVQSFVEQTQNERRQAEVKSISSAVDAFASNPANAHFAEVADQVVRLIQTGVANSLQEAYEQAVWANPATRAKEIARTTAAPTPPAVSKEAAKIAQVKKATAANVTTRAKSGSAATPLGSLDDTLEEALANIKSRA